MKNDPETLTMATPAAAAPLRAFNNAWYRVGLAFKLKVMRETLAAISWSGGRVLDVGCGAGDLSVLFDRATYTGIDITTDGIAHARARYAGDFRVANLLQADLAPASFDLVLLSSVVHHIDDATAADYLARIRTLLAPGGRAIIFEPVRPAAIKARWYNFVLDFMCSIDRGKFVRQLAGYRQLLAEWTVVREQIYCASSVVVYYDFVVLVLQPTAEK